LDFLDHGYDERRHWEHTSGEPSSERQSELRRRCTADSHDDWPIYGVSWAEAAAYADWCGKRLPTHLEWEYAVRGKGGERLFDCQDRPRKESVPLRDGTQTESQVYAWIGKSQPSSVRDPAFQSPEGFYHLCGNVAEWTATPYKGGSQPAFWVVGADFEQKRLVDSVPYWPRYDFKAVEVWDASGQESGMPHVGFRCALDAKSIENP